MFKTNFIKIEYVRKDGELRTFHKVEAKPKKTTKTHNVYVVHKRDGSIVFRSLIKKNILKTSRVKA